ncbi:hypothetical protein G647_10419 [Cladophialophora carrionii CBS 160.54]|uniref:Uncharacterized protein n=1 Tax=Cladophialophora carrionii CBS 160.54 TaxID=1279043 RepID=V9DIB0_9EURO|nr:uncharacterized protein G647_10419 [Cladophialophora carrionii CBS 160.54]ETI26605.1 hypothetical protein G647_10419 [Cladophialophora carrionii CBS 160.54]
MASDLPAPVEQDWVRLFHRFLNHGPAVDQILDQDATMFSEQAKKNLKRLHQHLNPARGRRGGGPWSHGERAAGPEEEAAEDFLQYIDAHKSTDRSAAEILLSPRVVDAATATQLIADLKNDDANDESDLWQLRQRFIWLMWFDIVKVIRPDISGRRLGRKARADIKSFVSTLEPDEDQVRSIVANIASWCRYGVRLQAICQIFGEGSIWILLPQLSHAL